MNEMDDEFLEVNDLDWFALYIDGFLAHFATGGQGFVPDSIRRSISEYELVYDFFHALNSGFEYDVVEENLPIFKTLSQRERYLQSFVFMAERGVFSYDFSVSGYRLIAAPKSGRNISDLPVGIKGGMFRLSLSSCDDIKYIEDF